MPHTTLSSTFPALHPHTGAVAQPPAENGAARALSDADLPRWDLNDLYPDTGPDYGGDALRSDLQRTEDAARQFQARYEGTLGELSGQALGAAVAEYERMQEILGRVMSYAQLVHARDMDDPEVGKFYQAMSERTTEISSALLFFGLELNRLDEAEIEAKLAAPELAKYRPWLRDLRAFRPYQLSDEVEKLLLEKYVAGRGAWNRLFDETMSALRFEVGGRALSSTEVLNLMVSRDPKVRKEAAQSLGRTLGQHKRTFALITNTLAKDKEIEDKWRRYDRPISSRNLANFVEDDVVDALVTSVRAAYPSLSHRYYRLKAKWFGSDTLDYWDRNAPLPDADDRVIPWEEASETVLGAYAAFSPALADVAKPFFEKPWIDAPVRSGKAPGAFAHPTVPSAHPYLLLNYQGKTRDVMTLAHELGHGVHQVLAGGQGHLMADTPLTLAETASVFGEMLTFQAILKREQNPKRRKVMLASKVEDMLNTVVRQIAMHSFEEKVHGMRRSGELTPDQLGDVWMETQIESLGPVFRFDEHYRNFWAYIPHFVHVPFYVYAYAFGDCLVNSLYAVYQGADEGFADKYLNMLRAGGTKRHKELLAPFGLNAGDPEFWTQGLGVVARLIDELEALPD